MITLSTETLYLLYVVTIERLLLSVFLETDLGGTPFFVSPSHVVIKTNSNHKNATSTWDVMEPTSFN